MTIRFPLAVATLVCLTAPAPVSAQADSPQAVVIVVEYADGRTTPQVVTAKGARSSTPMFPRVDGWQVPPGALLVSWVNYNMTLAAEGAVNVEISVALGPSRERDQKIATVTVKRGQHVLVDALEAVGVKAVRFTSSTLSASVLTIPRIVNRTSAIEVSDVSIETEPSARYHVTVRNVSARPVIAFEFITYRDEQRSLVGTKVERDASPIIAASGSYTFSLPPARTVENGTAWSALSHDALEISSALYQDGSIEGDPQPMASSLTLFLGRRAMLMRGVDALTRARGIGKPYEVKLSLKRTIEALSIEPGAADRAAVKTRFEGYSTIDLSRSDEILRSAMANTRKGMSDDLADAPDDAAAFEAWLATIIRTYQEWIDRFGAR